MSLDPENTDDEIRSPKEIARRALCLFAVTGLAAGADRQEVLQWLRGSDLWNSLTPREIGFVDNPAPSEKQINDMGWQCERLIVLLWSLRLIERLPAPDKQCNPSNFGTDLPPVADVSVEDFILHARIRPEKELWEMCDEILGLHWEAREAKLGRRKSGRPIDIGIIQERHHAINWVTGYGGLPWDEVTRDTWRPSSRP